MKSPRPSRPAASGAAIPAAKGKGPDAAFDLWLDRSLRTLCEGVAQEPLPADLLALIAADEAAAGTRGEAAQGDAAGHAPPAQNAAGGPPSPSGPARGGTGRPS